LLDEELTKRGIDAYSPLSGCGGNGIGASADVDDAVEVCWTFFAVYA
jgi:hypothetical protein